MEIVGLNSRPEYNNTFGVIEGFNENTSRYQVRMEHDETLKDLKDKNLVSYVGKRDEIAGLRSKPEYNGTTGTILAWNNGQKRWKVRMDYDSSLKDLKPDNLTLIPDG